MNNEHNIINSITATTLVVISDMYQRLMPFLILGLILIATDARFGIAAARKRGESISMAKMWRKALNKFVDYICWVTLAGIFGHTYGQILGIPILAALILLVIYGIELSSCFNNYFESKGINKKINIWRFLGRSDIEESLEDTKKQKKKNGEN